MVRLSSGYGSSHEVQAKSREAPSKLKESWDTAPDVHVQGVPQHSRQRAVASLLLIVDLYSALLRRKPRRRSRTLEKSQGISFGVQRRLRRVAKESIVSL